MQLHITLIYDLLDRYGNHEPHAIELGADAAH